MLPVGLLPASSLDSITIHQIETAESRPEERISTNYAKERWEQKWEQHSGCREYANVFKYLPE